MGKLVKDFWSRSLGRKKLEINLGRRCNLRCAFCMSGSTPDAGGEWEESYEHALMELQVMMSGEKKDTESELEVGFIGGEPTIHKDLPKLVEAAENLGAHEVSLCTNGVLLSQKERARHLIASGLTRVTVSVHSHRSEVEDRLTGRQGALDRKIQALRHLIALYEEGELAHPVAINTVVHKKNYRELDAFVEFFSSIGVKDIRFNALRPEGRGREASSYVVRLSTSAPRVLQAVLLGWKQGVRITCGGFPPCVWPRQVHFRPDVVRWLWADAFEPHRQVSEHVPGGKADRFSWEEMRTKALKVKTSSCERCVLNPRCEGLWASYASIFGTKELRPVSKNTVCF